jgi:predicted dehydrogenase
VGELLPAFNLSRECEVGALVTGDRDKGLAFARVLGLDESRVVSYEEMSRLREFEDVRAAYIVTPNHRHRRDTEAAAGAGLHVLCEKPMAPNPDDCRAMMDACERAERRLMIAYRVHYEPLNAKVREMIQKREHGQPHFVSFDTVQDVGKAPQYRLDRERNGGGSLFDLGIYPLNTTRYLLQEEPVEVSAMQWSDPKDPRFKEIEQNIAFQLRFPSGCIASCTSSFGTQRVNRYKVMCADGWLGMDPATSYRGLKASHGDDTGTHEMKLEEINQFAAEVDHFARCIREDKEPDTPGPEGLRDVNLMLAIYRAARERRAIKVGDDGAAVD